MIKSGELVNRMTDVKDPVGADEVQKSIERAKGKRKPEAEPDLAERIAAARALPLPGAAPHLHCAHCYGEGRDAAIRAFETPTNGA